MPAFGGKADIPSTMVKTSNQVLRTPVTFPFVITYPPDVAE
jgi:hypothetical protein